MSVMPPDTAPTESNDSVFREAQESFLSSLPHTERSRFSACTSASELLAGVESFGAFRGEHKKWNQLSHRVKTFSNTLQPYFNIITILLQSNPHWTAIAWGALRLILQLMLIQLASSFNTFFERLGEVLERLGDLIPHYADAVALGNHHVSDRLRSSLRKFYIDLFDFFKAVANVFTGKCGKIKRTPVVIGELLWQPFNNRFENVLERLKFHSKVLRDELHLLHLKCTVSVFEVHMEESRKADEYRLQSRSYWELVQKLEARLTKRQFEEAYTTIRDWLRPPQFMEIFELSKDLRAEGTAKWLFNENVFTEWRDERPALSDKSPYQSFLWVKGIPGAGKTILAAATVQELKQLSTIVCFYFFSYTSADKFSLESACKSILAQILQQSRNDERILDIFSFAQYDAKSAQSHPSLEELLELLSTISQRIQKFHLVLDGIDENNDPDKIIKRFAGVFQNCEVRVILFSRPNVQSLRKENKVKSLTISSAFLESDLRVYFSRELSALQDEELLPTSTLTNELINHLVSRAIGMFLWARLMIIYLSSEALTQQLRLEAIQILSSPEQLDRMYIRILGLIAKKVHEERRLARRIFLWLSYQKAELSAGQLEDILTPLKTDDFRSRTPMSKFEASNRFSNFEHTVIMVCHSLVELSHRHYRFIHYSVFTFFQNWAHSFDEYDTNCLKISRQFLAFEAEAESELGTACISYLLFKTPAQPLSGDLRESASKSQVKQAFPFLEYAAVHWIDHLAFTKSEYRVLEPLDLKVVRTAFRELSQIMSKFLSLKLTLMSWVESLYTFAHASLHTTLYAKMEAWSKWDWAQTLDDRNLEQALLEVSIRLSGFTDDLKTMHCLWGPTLNKGPHEIWNDITAFTPSPFFTQTAATSVKSIGTTQMRESSLSGKPLASISVEAGYEWENLGMLSIWPTKSFEKFWAELDLRNSIVPLTEQCSGWIVHYAIWTTGEEDPLCEKDWKIALDEHEVKRHVEGHILRAKRAKRVSKSRSSSDEGFCWALSFPLTISRNLKVIIVLRTAYVFTTDLGGGGEHSVPNRYEDPWQSIKIPVSRAEASVPLQHSLKSGSKIGDQSKDFSVSHSYTFDISDSGCFILEKESNALSFIADRKPTVISLAVYELIMSDSNNSCVLVGLLGGDAQMFFGHSGHCVLHPKLPLVLVYMRSFSSEPSIVLWSFTRNFSRLSAIPEQKAFGDVVSSPCSKFLNSFKRSRSSVESLNFSSCGTQIVVKLSGQFLLEVQSIVMDPAYEAAWSQCYVSSSECEPLDAQEHTQDESNHTERQITKLSSTSFELGKTTASDSSSRRVIVSSGGISQRNIQVVQRSAGVEEIQPLVSLPDWAGIDNVDIGVRESGAQDDHIKITLNKLPQPLYDWTDPIDMNLPCIVRKDRRALGPSQKRNANCELPKEFKRVSQV